MFSPKYLLWIILLILGTSLGIRMYKKENLLSGVRPINQELAEISSYPKKNSASTTSTTSTEIKEKLRRSFSSNDNGKRIFTISELSKFNGDPSPEGQKLEQVLKEARDKPEESFEEISKSVLALPPEFEESRRFLIQFAAQLNVSQEAKIELIKQDLEHYRTQPPTDFSSTLGPLISFDTLMDVTDDPNILAEELGRLLTTYKGTAAGKGMLVRFRAKFPAEAESFSF